MPVGKHGPSHLANALSWMLLCGLLATGVLQAQTHTDHIADLLDTPGSAGLGFISRIEQSPYIDGGHRTDLLPLYLYEGERFFLNADRVGVKFVNDDTHRLDGFLGRRLEGFPEDEMPEILEGMDVRNTSIDLGVAYRYAQPWGTLRASVMHDVGGISEGSELRLGYSYDWRGQRWLLRPDITVAWRDSNLNNYYYGVAPHEATPERPAYAPGSGVNVSLGLYGTYGILKNWRLLGGVSVTALDSDVRNSPIIRDDLQPALFVGAVYDFGTAITRWDDDQIPLLVKVFYGRASADGCHMANIMTLSCTSLNHENPTSVTGVHVGRPFLERVNGWPLDFNGYVGLLFRDENGLQANGWQVDAYMKAFYYGFPWSRRVNTRFGFGFGISYANHVPWTEVSSQARRERPTSKLLNYLDPTIDVNVGDIFRSENWRKTYFGLGISHRSGIFASSRLLGSVNGGSNYIYAYLESEF
ncbi:outer membrane protein [Luteimonas cucumeris]|uniref:Outer membrane protein n=2 Tax=Luteimonas cucumeris TaxID=985012 RepID=A0A562L2K7_9GAMM|nr:outer membrane protein [Luteimonas cucumeris]